MAALGPYRGPPIASVLGRSERFDPLLVSILNGFSTPIHCIRKEVFCRFLRPAGLAGVYGVV